MPARPIAAGLLLGLSALVTSGRARGDADACAKLAESRGTPAAIGARLQVAQCDERAGRTASAWAGYLEVASMAKSRGQASRAKAAADKAAQLEPKVARLLIDVGSSSTPGLRVTRNDVLVEPSEYNTPVPVDPGPQIVEVAAPDHQVWRTTFEITSQKRLWEVHSPELEPNVIAKVDDVRGPPPVDGRAFWTTRRSAAVVLAAAGVVAVGSTALFAVHAANTNADAEAHCRGTTCDRVGAGLRSDAVASGNVATVTAVLGAGLIVTACTLWFFVPEERAPAAKVGVALGAGRVHLTGIW